MAMALFIDLPKHTNHNIGNNLLFNNNEIFSQISPIMLSCQNSSKLLQETMPRVVEKTHKLAGGGAILLESPNGPISGSGPLL